MHEAKRPSHLEHSSYKKSKTIIKETNEALEIPSVVLKRIQVLSWLKYLNIIHQWRKIQPFCFRMIVMESSLRNLSIPPDVMMTAKTQSLEAQTNLILQKVQLQLYVCNHLLQHILYRTSEIILRSKHSLWPGWHWYVDVGFRPEALLKICEKTASTSSRKCLNSCYPFFFD